jgi:hypothetical protein
MAATRHRFGTNIRNSIDSENFRKAARSVGADLRYWCSNGTVATVDTETGEFNPNDKAAVWNASDGVDVDVKLEPLMIPVTCRYAGIQAGDVTILAPIRPGDIVKCDFPDGDLTGGIITNILHSRSNRQPTDSGKPIFGNDRLLIYAKSVPIDIRTAGGVQVTLDQDGNATVTTSKAIELNANGTKIDLDSSGAVVTAPSVQLGGADAVEPVQLGQTRTVAETTFIGAAEAAASALYTAATLPANPALSPLGPGFSALLAAFTAFLAELPTFNSTVTKTK